MKKFILKKILKKHDVIKSTMAQFNVSRQAVHQRLQKMTDDCEITVEKQGKHLVLGLVTAEKNWSMPLSKDLAEDVIYRQTIAPSIQHLPQNVLSIWHYGMTEMVNNAIDHSGGTELCLRMKQSAVHTELIIRDNGEGIFLKIQKAFHLAYPEEAILELAKGKLTTDPSQHTGEGIFFSSRMFDHFGIQSGTLSFSRSIDEPREQLEAHHQNTVPGTTITLSLLNDTPRQSKAIFDEYASELDDYAFNRTVVPVILAQYEGQDLISRSQAKRLTHRFEKFKYVVLDFTGVETLGQAFADELFRVFKNAHPEIELSYTHANDWVSRMIARAVSPH